MKPLPNGVSALPRFLQKLPAPALAVAFLAALALPSAAAPGATPVPAERHAHLSELSGMYKVASSTDPLFSATGGSEWFLDFGRGTADGRRSGTVAVSMRRNPNVRVRILVWQFYPESHSLRIGNQTAEGSKQAVLLADWSVSRRASGLILRRAGYHAVLRPAGPED